MNYEKWIEKFEPQPNHIEKNAPYNGFMFETYGEEYEYIRKSDSNYLWTLISGEGDCIAPGFHIVNRLGYFITKFPWKDVNDDVNIDDE